MSKSEVWRMTEELEKQEEDEKIHPIQKLFERPFLLLAAGMIVMVSFYTLWGIAELMLMEKAPLP